jgi:hypothetical protein
MTLYTDANSITGRRRLTRRKSPQRSRVGNGSALLADVDGRSTWVRRCKELIADHVSDLEPIREVWIHEEAFAARRLSMMRIMARRTKAATVIA